MPSKPTSSGPRYAPERFGLNDDAIRQLARQVSMESIRPRTIASLSEFHDYQVIGADRVFTDRPAVDVVNLCYIPFRVGSVTLSEHSVITLATIAQRLNHPILSLPHLQFYVDPRVAGQRRADLARLGFFPGTVDNARRVLELGNSLFVAPEGRDSIPGYRTRPFYWSFAKVAWMTGVPRVPMAFSGPHEAVLRVISNGRLKFMNLGRRNRVPFRLELLPAIDPRTEIELLDDTQALSRFCDDIRTRIQHVLDRQTEGRALAKLAARLHTLHSGTDC